MNNVMASQRDSILEYLEAGNTLTTLEAIKMFGCIRLAARITELRQKGVPVVTRMIPLANDKWIGLYYIAGPLSLIPPKREGIPCVLCDIPQWILWRAEKRVLADGTEKINKIPVCVADPRKAGSTTDAATWGTFGQAWSRYEHRDANVSGVGFVFTKSAGVVGVDLDDCFGERGIAPDAREIVRRLDSYTEISVSGRGLHVFVRGILPWPGRRKGPIEMYAEGRFFTVTGAALPESSEVTGDQEALDALVREIWTPDPRAAADSRADEGHVSTDGKERGASAERRGMPSGLCASAQSFRECSLFGPAPDDEEIIRKASNAKNGAKFSALWRGDWGPLGYPSQSEADLALLSMLLYWTDGDRERADALFRKSGLMRPKWDQAGYRTRCFACLRKGAA